MQIAENLLQCQSVPGSVPERVVSRWSPLPAFIRGKPSRYRNVKICHSVDRDSPVTRTRCHSLNGTRRRELEKEGWKHTKLISNRDFHSANMSYSESACGSCGMFPCRHKAFHESTNFRHPRTTSPCLTEFRSASKQICASSFFKNERQPEFSDPCPPPPPHNLLRCR